MSNRRLLVVVALALLLPVCGLVPLANASPPDPSWIRGLYDGADYDDVVILIASVAGTSTPTVLGDLSPLMLLRATASLHSDRRHSYLAVSAHLTRGPPSS